MAIHLLSRKDRSSLPLSSAQDPDWKTDLEKAYRILLPFQGLFHRIHFRYRWTGISRSQAPGNGNTPSVRPSLSACHPHQAADMPAHCCLRYLWTAHRIPISRYPHNSHRHFRLPPHGYRISQSPYCPRSWISLPGLCFRASDLSRWHSRFLLPPWRSPLSRRRASTQAYRKPAHG